MTFLIARSRDVPLRLLPVVVFSRNPLAASGLRRRAPPRDSRRLVRLPGWRPRPTRRPPPSGFARCWPISSACRCGPCGVDHARRRPRRRRCRPAERPPLHPQTRTWWACCERVSSTPPSSIPCPTDRRFAPVAPDPEGAYASWQQRHGARTLNHVVVVRESLADDAEIMARVVRAVPGEPPAGRAGSRYSVHAAWTGREPPEPRDGRFGRGGRRPVGPPAHGGRSGDRRGGSARVAIGEDSDHDVRTCPGISALRRRRPPGPPRVADAAGRTRAWLSSPRLSGFMSPGARAIRSISVRGATTSGIRSS